MGGGFMRRFSIFSIFIFSLLFGIVFGGAVSAVENVTTLNGEDLMNSDITAPTITATDPAQNEVNVSKSQVITVTFSEDIKAGSNWIEVLNSSGSPVPLTTSINDNVLIINPEVPFSNGKHLLIIHTGSVTDLAGNQVAAYVSSFTVDAIGPRVSTTDPANKATNVAATKEINITFNENIQSGSMWIELVNSSGSSIPLNFSINGKTLTITHEPLLESPYNLLLHTGALTDSNGNPTSPQVSKFSVKSVVTSIDPAHGTLNVIITKDLKVTFNDFIQAGSMWIELVNSSGTSIPLNFSINGKTLTITHEPLLESPYNLLLHTGALTDLAGNRVTSQISTFSAGTYVARIEVIYSGTGGDITKNSLVYNSIPHTSITDQILAAAKKGTPMVTIGTGSGPKVMIVAGVHGNELPAVIAVMKLINDLSKKSMAGTIYVVPFAIPSNTVAVTRYWNGVNPNHVANQAGTPTNKIITMAKQLKVKALADFHSTQPGGVPGKNSILCTKYPTYESYKIALSISKQTGHSLIYEYQAGASYPGAVEDVCNLAKIPAVTCEVLSAHGTVASGSVTSSYNQMIAFLRYETLIN